MKRKLADTNGATLEVVVSPLAPDQLFISADIAVMAVSRFSAPSLIRF